ncbi:hypothetical protein C7974DRAFT_272701, partial [Boeremia exigua]|uniref:uncharacterized protein n=1 Tax=Boeremia exigua TaxID=749465 RepID=UPI001E8D7FDC
VYRSGDSIEGNVILIPKQSMKPDSILVSLLGRSTVFASVTINTTCGSSTRIWIDKAPILELTKESLAGSKGESLEPGESYSFPFTFCIPVSTSAIRDSYRKSDDQRWTTEPHVLPPTFWESMSASSGGNFARIDYG